MFFSKKNGELILVLDVQSSIVRGTLVHKKEEEIPVILFTYSFNIPYKSNVKSGYLVRSALQGVEKIVHEMAKHIHIRSRAEEIPKKISSVHFVLSSPWVVSQAKTLKASFNQDTAINNAYIRDVISQERMNLSGNNKEDIRIVEEKVFDVRLNGYSVTSWKNIHTRALEISFVVSVAGGRMIDRFVRACDYMVHRDKVYFHSSLFLQHLGIERVVPNSSSYTLLHIHGELTDVALVHNNSCTFFGSYPFGVQSIIRNISLETKTDEKAAESLLNIFVQGHLDSTHADNEMKIMKNMDERWINEFKKLVKTSSTPDIIPNHVLISAHSHQDFFEEIFEEAYPGKIIETLTIDRMTGQIIFDSHADRLLLPALYVIAINNLGKN